MCQRLEFWCSFKPGELRHQSEAEGELRLSKRGRFFAKEGLKRSNVCNELLFRVLILGIEAIHDELEKDFW